MLDYSTMKPEGILALKPNAPLNREDFIDLSAAADSYLSGHAKLHGVLIHAKGFPGWENFGGPAAHMHFVRERHKKVERAAIVTDSQIAEMAESPGRRFASSELRHFPFVEDMKALDWLKTH